MKTKKLYKIKAKVWLYPGESGNWHFISVPKKESAEIKKSFGSRARGFGSLRVSATIGTTTWTTSIFPDSKSGTYILPLKALVRRKEGLYEGDSVAFSFAITV